MSFQSFKHLVRRLLREPGFTALNVSGLALGLTCCFLIGLYIQNEVTYDRFHPEADRIVRVIQREADGGGMSTIGGAASRILRNDIPQVESVVGIDGSRQTLTRVDDATGATSSFEESGFVAATPELFDVFSGFQMLQGDASKALTQPNELVLTASAAEKYFGAENPIGQTLYLGDEGPKANNPTALTVVGVMSDPPKNSHLQFSMAASVSAVYGRGGRTDFISGSFWYPAVWLYARLKPGTDREAAESAYRSLVAENRRASVAERFSVEFQTLTDIHLSSAELSRSPSTPGDPTRVWTFGAIAFFVLVIACVNFINLSTARAMERAKEIGVRKTLGASSGSLVGRVLSEALFVSGISVLIAMGLTSALRPVLEQTLDVSLEYAVFGNGWLWLGALAAVLITGLGAGSYPALVLSRFDPAEALSDLTSTGRSRSSRLRQSLVVVQFAITIILVIGTATAFQQLQFMQSANLGFDTDEVVVMDTPDNVDQLRTELLRREDIKNITFSQYSPGVISPTGPRYEINGKRPDDPEERISEQSVAGNFFEMMDVEILAGRTFSAHRSSDLGIAKERDEDHAVTWWRELPVVINKSTAEKFGWTPQEALGQNMRLYIVEGNTYWGDFSGPVIGVVEDFHTGSLREAIPPTVFTPATVRQPDGSTQLFGLTRGQGRMLVKVGPGDASNVMEMMEDAWAKTVPGETFESTFLNARIQQLYDTERRVGRMMGGFAALAILVACLGLIGLAAYTTRQRTKEIGIRKALGASVTGIVTLLSRDFLKLVALAIVIASPIGYWIAEQWLEQFAYRITPGVGLLAGSAIVVLLVAILAVSVQTIRAARTRPAHVMRSE